MRSSVVAAVSYLSFTSMTTGLSEAIARRISRTSGCLGMSDRWESVNSRGETGWRAGEGRFLPPGSGLTYHIVRMKTAGIDATREVSMGKLIAGQLISKVADGCLQMYGGMGFMNEALISRYCKDARIVSIGGGADEIMKEILTKIEGFWRYRFRDAAGPQKLRHAR